MNFFFQAVTGTAFDNNNPALWRMGEKSVENGIYMAVTDAPVPIRFNITDLSTIGRQGFVDLILYNYSLSLCTSIKHKNRR